jgi:hypothetical protein
MTNEIVGTLFLFESSFFLGKLAFKCCNSLISLCIGFEEKDLGHEIIQIGILDCFKKLP